MRERENNTFRRKKKEKEIRIMKENIWFYI